MADDIERKLDQILVTLNRIEPPVMRLGVEDVDTARSNRLALVVWQHGDGWRPLELNEVLPDCPGLPLAA